jgi:putative ATP-binding cassette transporter
MHTSIQTLAGDLQKKQKTKLEPSKNVKKAKKIYLRNLKNYLQERYVAGLLISPVGLLIAGVLAVLVFNVVVQVRLNEWHRDFFDAVEKKSANLITEQTLWFAAIAGVLLCAVVAQTLLHEVFKVRLRERVTNDLLKLWMAPGQAYRYRMASPENANPDQRIQEDARQMSDLSADLGVGFLQSALMLASFIAVLWMLSSGVVLPIGGYTLSVPGYMVWCALAYAGVGSYVAWRVGRPLMRLHAERFAREADFRFALVRANESAEAIALSRGEADERRNLGAAFGNALGVARKTANATARLTWVTSGYGWIGIIFPILVALPGYMQGTLSLGGLMMVVGAFNQVQAALKWFVDNFARIAEWSAAVSRVAVLRKALIAQRQDDGGPNVKPSSALDTQNLTLRLACGKVLIENVNCSIKPGERVMISGASGLGKSTLFRAFGGIWPWAEGDIEAPAGKVMFLPQRPYMPLGTLRGALAYPAVTNAFSDEAIAAALRRVGLDDFAALLDADERWDQRLSPGQQQRLAFARILLHRPDWVFLDEATSALDEANQQRVMSIFRAELPECAVISIAHQTGLEAFHDRVLQVVAYKDRARLYEKPRPGAIIVGGKAVAARGAPPLPALAAIVGQKAIDVPIDLVAADMQPPLAKDSEARARLGANIEASRMRRGNPLTVAGEGVVVKVSLKNRTPQTSGNL